MTINVSTLLRPRVILPLAAVILIAVVLMSPQETPDDRNGDLTTFSTGSGGVRGLDQTLHRLGWPVVQRKSDFSTTVDTNAVYLTLDPPISFTGGEVHHVLDAVRRGAGLVYVIQNGQDMADSLHLETGIGMPTHATADSADCQGNTVPLATMWFDNHPHLYTIASKNPWLNDTVHFLPLRSWADSDALANASPKPPTLRQMLHTDTDTVRYRTPFAMVGIPYGRGRILTVSDADALRNDVIRVCQWDVGRQVVQGMEWVSRDARPTLIFDEYHHGYQTHDRPMGVWPSMGEYLTETRSGRMVAQILTAGCIVLLVFGIRPIVPKAVKTIERRSALEHVSALSQAYKQINATRLAVRRLTRGLRRRHTVERWSTTATNTDALFLKSIATRYPQTTADVEKIRQGEEQPVPSKELVEIAESVARVDKILNTHRP